MSVQKKGEVGVVINTLEGEILKYEVQLQFPTTNNEVEYEAILTRLRIGKAWGAKNILLKSDSKQVIGQIRGEFEVNEGQMQKNLKLPTDPRIRSGRLYTSPLKLELRSRRGSKASIVKRENRFARFESRSKKHPSIEELNTFSIQD